MTALLGSPRIQLVLRLLLGAYFVYASLDKIASPAAFAKIIYQWQIGGPIASNVVAVTLPWIELVAGLLLIAGVWRREAALVIALLLVVFLVAAASVMARGIDVQNCGCVSLAKDAAASAWPPAWTRGVGWSVGGTGRPVSFGWAFPIPAPNLPPLTNASKERWTWYEALVGS